MKVSPEQAQQVLAEADCLFDAKAVDKAIDHLAESINRDYQDKAPLFIAVMNGGLATAGQLLTRLTIPLQVDYLHATRYHEGLNGQAVQWIKQPQQSLEGRDIIIVDDIFDEGFTLAAVIHYCQHAGAKSVRTAMLVNKIHDRKVKGLEIDYYALDVPDRYVFGFGMDYKGFLRNAPGIYAVKGS